jgi:hypothetical protein
VKVLKYEAFHDSPLARMLLRRALLAPYKIGHLLFWMLRYVCMSSETDMLIVFVQV